MSILLVLDLQEGFRYEQTEKILPKLFSVIHNFSGQIIFFKFIDFPGSRFEKDLAWPKFQQEENKRFLKEVDSYTKNAEIFTHSTYSLFTGEFSNFVKKHSNENFYLCGIYTDVCIEMAALELFDKGYKVKVVEDLCASPHDRFDPSIHKDAIASIEHAIGKDAVVKSDEIV